MKPFQLILIAITAVFAVNCKSSQKFDETQLQKGINLNAINSSNNIHIMKDTVVVFKDTIRK